MFLSFCKSSNNFKLAGRSKDCPVIPFSFRIGRYLLYDPLFDTITSINDTASTFSTQAFYGTQEHWNNRLCSTINQIKFAYEATTIVGDVKILAKLYSLNEPLILGFDRIMRVPQFREFKTNHTIYTEQCVLLRNKYMQTVGEIVIYDFHPEW